MRALVVLPLLLCAVVCVDQVRAQVTAMKLCGKQLINAISYTCGASRWRRFFHEPDVDGEKTLLLIISHNRRDAFSSWVSFFSLICYKFSGSDFLQERTMQKKSTNCIYPYLYYLNCSEGVNTFKKKLKCHLYHFFKKWHVFELPSVQFAHTVLLLYLLLWLKWNPTQAKVCFLTNLLPVFATPHVSCY